MCGIIAYIGPKATPSLLLQGLRRLEYRGYDSAGVAIQNDGKFYISKEVGRVAALEAQVDLNAANGAGIAHTRWATHGGVTEANAHPHVSGDGVVALVHNGIIENAVSLREKLIANGTIIKSETDSETIVHIVSNLYAGLGPFGVGENESTKGDPVESLRQALLLARGTWGIATMFSG